MSEMGQSQQPWRGETGFINRETLMRHLPQAARTGLLHRGTSGHGGDGRCERRQCAYLKNSEVTEISQSRATTDPDIPRVAIVGGASAVCI